MQSKVIARSVENDIELLLRESCINGRTECELIINGIFIMATYNHLSSELLVRNSLTYSDKQENLFVLIGGLGMGFSVREACLLKGIQKIDVVEKQSSIIEWNGHFLSSYNGSCLQDRRVDIIRDDFYDYIMRTDQKYDLITMDIDNGPMMLVESKNLRVYKTDFFEHIKTCLSPGGVFAIWSCNKDQALSDGLSNVFNHCTFEEATEEHSGQMVPYYLYFAY